MREDRNPGLLPVTTVVTWPLRGVCSGEGIALPGPRPRPGWSELQEGRPSPAWVCPDRLLFCAFTGGPRTPQSL